MTVRQEIQRYILNPGGILCNDSVKFHLNNLLRRILARDLAVSPVMAHSKWEYVKKFELDDTLLPNSFAVARIDGRGILPRKMLYQNLSIILVVLLYLILLFTLQDFTNWQRSITGQDQMISGR